MEPIIAGRDLTFSELSAVLAKISNIRSEKLSAFAARIRNFQRLDLDMHGVSKGRGATGYVSRSSSVLFALAFELTALGLPPNLIVKMIHENWEQLTEAFREAAKGGKPIAVFECIALSDALGSVPLQKIRIIHHDHLPETLISLRGCQIIWLATVLGHFSKAVIDLRICAEPKPGLATSVVGSASPEVLAPASGTLANVSEASSLRDDLLRGAKEAAQFTGLPVRTVYRMVDNNQIPHTRMGAAIYFRKSELEKAFR